MYLPISEDEVQGVNNLAYTLHLLISLVRDPSILEEDLNFLPEVDRRSVQLCLAHLDALRNHGGKVVKGCPQVTMSNYRDPQLSSTPANIMLIGKFFYMAPYSSTRVSLPRKERNLLMYESPIG